MNIFSSFTKRRDLERRGSSDATKYNETMVHNHTESEILENEFNKNFFSSDIYHQGRFTCDCDGYVAQLVNTLVLQYF